MKSHHFLILVALICLLIAPTAADVSDSTVTNTNVYAGSNVFDIAPPANVTTSTASGITNVANRYIYAAALENSVSEKTATLYLINQQGATVNLTDNSIVSGLSIDYGDGTTGSSLTHTYAADGIYNVTVTATNYLDQTGITLTDRVQIGETSISITVSPVTLTTGQSWTLTANAVIADSIQWQVSRNNASWTNIPDGTYTPSEYGTYYFRAIAYGADRAAYSNVEQTTYQYAVSDSTVTNTNVYATSNVFDIAPSGYYDAASTASGITNVAGRYLYASALEVIENGRTAIYNIIGLQGSTTTLTSGRITQGYLWDYGDGTTSTTTQLSHTYGAPGMYVATLGLTNYLDSTGVSLTGDAMYVGPIVGALTADKTAGGVGDVFNLTIDATNYTSLEWQLSRQAVGGWSTISGAVDTTYTLIPDASGHWYIRCIVTNTTTGFSTTTDKLTITVYAKPATGNIKVSPDFGPLETQVQLSAGVEDPGSSLQATTYQWQISPAGGNWTNIAGATQKSSTVTLDLDASGTYYFRIAATGIGGTAYSAPAEYRAYSAPVFETVSVSPTKGGAPLQVKLSATASDATAYRWEYSTGGGVWMQVAKSAAAYYTLNAEGTFYFRAVATGFGGTTYSDAVTVDVGDLPDVSITSPQYSGMWFETGSTVSFSAEDESGVTYSWNFGDGSTGSGRSVSHAYSAPGKYEVVLSASNYFGTKQDRVVVIISDPTGDVQLMVDRVSTTGAELTGTITVSPVDAGTLMWFEIESLNGQTIWRSAKQAYNTGAISIDASGMPMMSGHAYQAIAYTNNYGYSLPQLFVLLDAVQAPHEPLGDAWNNGLNREPFNVSALVAAGVGVFGGALGGGAVGAAVSFGVIAMFVLVGLWLRQQDIVVPLTLTLIAGWFVIGNLPGDWQPIAYTLMVVCVVAIFFYLFRKRIE